MLGKRCHRPALGTTGLGIFVRCDRLPSAAHYYVESVEQTMQFLAMLNGRVDEYGLGGLGSLGLLFQITSAFGDYLACEYLDQPCSPRRREDLPGEQLFRSHRATVILGIRVISCANDRPFQRDTGKQPLTPAVGINGG